MKNRIASNATFFRLQLFYILDAFATSSPCRSFPPLIIPPFLASLKMKGEHLIIKGGKHLKGGTIFLAIHPTRKPIKFRVLLLPKIATRPKIKIQSKFLKKFSSKKCLRALKKFSPASSRCSSREIFSGLPAK